MDYKDTFFVDSLSNKYASDNHDIQILNTYRINLDAPKILGVYMHPKGTFSSIWSKKQLFDEK